MAGADKIINRILDDARAQAEINKENAQHEAASILEQAKQLTKAKVDKIIADANKDAMEAKRFLIAAAELEEKKELLRAKQDVLDLAFSKALDQLCSYPDNEYQAILIDLIANSAETGNEIIVLSEVDKGRMTPDFIDQVNQRVISKGLSGKMKLADSFVAIKGGFILKAADIELNYSFEAIIKMIYNNLAMDVANILF